MTSQNNDNRREYFRVRFLNPLCAELKVEQINKSPSKDKSVPESSEIASVLNDDFMDSAIQDNMLNEPIQNSSENVSPDDDEKKAGLPRICINDIGPGGLLFSTNQKLDVTPNVILDINMQILNENIKVFACIVRCKEIDADYFQYGAKFVMMDENLRSRIFRMFSTLSIRTRTNISLPSCCFCEVGREGCWKYKYEPVAELEPDYPSNSFSKNRNV